MVPLGILSLLLGSVLVVGLFRWHWRRASHLSARAIWAESMEKIQHELERLIHSVTGDVRGYEGLVDKSAIQRAVDLSRRLGKLRADVIAKRAARPTEDEYREVESLIGQVRDLMRTEFSHSSVQPGSATSSGSRLREAARLARAELEAARQGVRHGKPAAAVGSANMPGASRRVPAGAAWNHGQEVRGRSSVFTDAGLVGIGESAIGAWSLGSPSTEPQGSQRCVSPGSDGASGGGASEGSGGGSSGGTSDSDGCGSGE